MARTRSDVLGPAARPVSVPEGIDEPGIAKASGMVELPFHIRWTDPPMTYDLGSITGRVRVYEQVLREGTEEDVRYFIDVNELLSLWDQLVLPPTVRRAWAAWFRTHRSLDLGC